MKTKEQNEWKTNDEKENNPRMRKNKSEREKSTKANKGSKQIKSEYSDRKGNKPKALRVGGGGAERERKRKKEIEKKKEKEREGRKDERGGRVKLEESGRKKKGSRMGKE